MQGILQLIFNNRVIDTSFY